MTLKQISEDYRVAAKRISGRLAVLRKALKEETDGEVRWHLKREIAELTPVLTQLNELAELTEHYYDRGYYRNEKYCF